MSHMSSSSSRAALHVLLCDGGCNTQRGCYGSWCILQWVTCADPAHCKRKRRRCPLGEVHLYRYCPESRRRLVERYTFDLPYLRTSNEAEWAALCRGLLALKEHGITGQVVIVGDSRLVLNQFTGQWQVWADNLRPLYQEARERLKALDCAVFCEWRPRHVIEAWLGH